MSRSRCSSSFFFLTLEHKPPRAAPVRRFFVACKVTVGRGTHKKSGSYFHPFFFSLYSTVSPSKRKKYFIWLLNYPVACCSMWICFFPPSLVPCFSFAAVRSIGHPFFFLPLWRPVFFSVNNAHDHARGLRSTPFFPPIQALTGMAMEGLPFFYLVASLLLPPLSQQRHMFPGKAGGGHCAIHK